MFQRDILGKKACNVIAIPEKQVSIMSLSCKNRTQELGFLKIRYFANLVVIMHFEEMNVSS